MNGRVTTNGWWAVLLELVGLRRAQSELPALTGCLITPEMAITQQNRALGEEPYFIQQTRARSGAGSIRTRSQKKTLSQLQIILIS